MKKTVLWGALFTLITTQANSEATQQAISTQNSASTGTNVVSESTNQVPTTNQNTQQNQLNQPVQSNGQQPTQSIQNNQQNQPSQTGEQQSNQNTQNNQQNQPAQQQTTKQPAQQQVPSQQTAPVINCDYKISAETKAIEQSLVLTWSEKAIIQSFDFDPATVDAQLQKLQACFTDQGWLSFNSALQKSGNLDAIKSQKLHVSSQIDGQPQVTEAIENQWKIIIPLQVVYQNDKEKVTQLLNVNVTVGRKITGDLGINQMIAVPRTATNTSQTNSPSNTNPADANTSTPQTPGDTTNNATQTNIQTQTGTPTNSPPSGSTTNTQN
ncbi:TPA: type IV secretion protein IcmL [Legionella pneumophila]|uniref:DotI/IcmL family type IV secretion protein n=1 Tax=Legionella TaxID=445 RepID=UPI0007788754|nr:MULTISPECIES: DotI/IcmL family type IV secretion protein [Legionella]HAT8860106.1 type IV secretion protein IcmL [Legionella pneumophila subsp. pneumophila]MCW8395679.1 DotI/IcmL family type IV secretion protein [Legionella sp. PATHC039]HAT8580835.1 type IV secretion protein IcmL [Legionella pneumophila]HAT9651803.1 type IV secretion protein IcmL [Legionella pneumophila subsp. pneumophila]HAT9921025.1 type IV secretion protein IcmL [Legionella pneumophila subsp. pneumophila]